MFSLYVSPDVQKKKKKSQQQQTYKEVFTSLVGIFNKQMLIKPKRARLRVNFKNINCCHCSWYCCLGCSTQCLGDSKVPFKTEQPPPQSCHISVLKFAMSFPSVLELGPTMQSSTA